MGTKLFFQLDNLRNKATLYSITFYKHRNSANILFYTLPSSEKISIVVEDPLLHQNANSVKRAIDFSAFAKVAKTQRYSARKYRSDESSFGLSKDSVCLRSRHHPAKNSELFDGILRREQEFPPNVLGKSVPWYRGRSNGSTRLRYSRYFDRYGGAALTKAVAYLSYDGNSFFAKAQMRCCIFHPYSGEYFFSDGEIECFGIGTVNQLFMIMRCLLGRFINNVTVCYFIQEKLLITVMFRYWCVECCFLYHCLFFQILLVLNYKFNLVKLLLNIQP